MRRDDLVGLPVRDDIDRVVCARIGVVWTRPDVQAYDPTAVRRQLAASIRQEAGFYGFTEARGPIPEDFRKKNGVCIPERHTRSLHHAA